MADVEGFIEWFVANKVDVIRKTMLRPIAPAVEGRTTSQINAISGKQNATSAREKATSRQHVAVNRTRGSRILPQ